MDVSQSGWWIGLLLCLGPVFGQAPEPEAPPRPESPGAERPGSRPAVPPEAGRAEAAALLRAFRKNLQAARANPLVRIEVVQALVERTHVSFLRPLLDLGRKDPSRLVRAAAFKALGALDYPETRKELARLLGESSLLDEPLVLLGVLEAAERLGYDPAWHLLLESLLRRAFDKIEEPAVVQQRIIRLFGQGKEKRAFRLLVMLLDEPCPENPDYPTSQPSAWWEKRWKAWRAFRPDVKEALVALTGVEFDRASLYRTWALKEGARHGIK